MKATELKDVLENGRSGTRLAAEILACLCWQVCYFCLYPGHLGLFLATQIRWRNLMGKGKVCKTLLLKSSAFLKKRKKKHI